MGILGLGRIGKAIARRAAAFGLDIVYHGRRQQKDAPFLYYPTLIGMARACDILMIVAPGGADTRHIVDREIIDAVGPDGIIVNISRGSLVDEQALIAALREGRLLGGRPRRLRRRAERAARAARARQRRAAAPCRLGLAPYPPGDGRSDDRQSRTPGSTARAR